MNTKQTDRDILGSKTIWKSTNQVAEIATTTTKKKKSKLWSTANQPRKELYTLKASWE